MRAALFALLCTALLLGCAPRLGNPKLTVGGVSTLTLTHPSNDQRRWYLPVTLPDGEDWLFFFDTGYSYSTCDDGLIAALGLPTSGKVHIRGELGRIEATRAKLPDLLLGEHRLSGLACAVRDLHSTSSVQDPPEVRIAGVLGMDALRQLRVQIDPQLGLLTLSDPSAAPRLDKRMPEVVKLRREQGGPRMLVPLYVGDARTWPVLDTGATSTHLDTVRLGLTPTRVRRDVMVRGSGLEGQARRDISYVDTGPVSLGAFITPQLALVQRRSSAFSSDGLVGLDLLRRIKQDYDFKHKLARFDGIRGRPLASWQTLLTEGGTLYRARFEAPTPQP